MLLSRRYFPWQRGTGQVPGGDWEIVLDLSRLVGRVTFATPTGVDRVEMAYARELLARFPERVTFAAVHPAGGFYGRLPTSAVRQFLSFTLARWQNETALAPEVMRRAAIRQLIALRPRPVPPPTRARIYLQASPHHLGDIALVGAILKTEQARMVTLVHDVIPITHPEYARPSGAVEHRQRMATVDRHSDGIIANSQATLEALQPLLTRPGARVLRVAHLGSDLEDEGWALGSGAVPAAPSRPYFVCIATIEPRKNHLMLLNVWRRLVERHGEAAPDLVLIGRRGWENENVIDMLERCTVIQGHVREAGDIADAEMFALLRGARALLLPSFAEGFGIPLIEAFSAQVPVICSDIAALREVGGAVPEYLDPLDGIGWLEAVYRYTPTESPDRVAQLARLRGWSPGRWADHIDIVVDAVAQVALG